MDSNTRRATPDFSTLASAIESQLHQCREPAAGLLAICQTLAGNLPHYDWVGFYLVDPARPRELFLGPFVGAPTAHVRIPFGRGICGQAAAAGRTFVIDDVTRESNYLSCGISVRAEIVAPIFHGGALAGELDVDAHQPAAFTEEDRRFLERVCVLAAPFAAALSRRGCSAPQWPGPHSGPPEND